MRRVWAGTTAISLFCCAAFAQQAPVSEPIPSAIAPTADPTALATSAGPTPYAALPPAPVQLEFVPIPGDPVAEAKGIVNLIRRNDFSGLKSASALAASPGARKLALWGLADAGGHTLTFTEADKARRELIGWPRGSRRQLNGEKTIGQSALGPREIVAWFDGAPPTIPEGAMALTGAYLGLGDAERARSTIQKLWTTVSFDAPVQRAILDKFGTLLTAQDHIGRTDMLLYGPHGPGTREMIQLLPEPQKSQALARMAVRSGNSNAETLISGLAPGDRLNGGIVFETGAMLRKRGQISDALRLVSSYPAAPNAEISAKLWSERRSLFAAAMKSQDYQRAYDAVANARLTQGADAAEAEFFAGWLALKKLGRPDLASTHFARIAEIGQSPITRSRAFYWMGRADQAQNLSSQATIHYRAAAQYWTSFYGQLAAEQVGITTLDIGQDPTITELDRQRFNSREPIQALKLLISTGDKDLVRTFVLALDDTMPNAAESALLVDLARTSGDADLAMRAIRTAAQRGFVLPERGYPVLATPSLPGAAETAFVLSISRQESNLDPMAKSAPGARGLMQLMPATGAMMARRLGEPYSVSRLHEGTFNLKLGSLYLGDMIQNFSGSYVMAAAAYNAGPGRPTEWAGLCGDPRGATTDPVDFIEFITFSEKRNNVMRTLETTMVYRARLNGGKTPMSLSKDLKRGAYGNYQVLSTSQAAPS
jgi:soluble lytic murein transglycosylase